LLLEDLTRARSSDDYERYIETFRRAAIDANPHQIEATIFALNRIKLGGALLCDEVGLGKTIEAGLVISELRARGADRILIVVPVPLARQWQVELQDLFSVNSIILDTSNFDEHDGPGVYLVGREFAGTEVRAAALLERGPWDLIVVDEAHEMLGGLYKRFSKKTDVYNFQLDKGQAVRAGWLKHLCGDSPRLLLTATPLQNNLYELWSLVHMVDGDETVLGPFHEFTRLYVSANGRSVRPGKMDALRSRLAEVVQRSLRHEVAPFLKVPFVKRTCETLDFSPTDEQGRLYRAVSDWLSKDDMGAYGRGRGFMATQVRRRMGSSPQALLATLNAMRIRLGKMIEEAEPGDDVPAYKLQDDLTDLEYLHKQNTAKSSF
jgi:SNF2 family DNA or RNA helicase